VIAPLTLTLHGFAAVHYARATGSALHRAEVRRAYGDGVVEPARTVSVDEAHALLQRKQGEARLITCEATHGALPYRGSGPIEIDWPALHVAAIVVDAERSDGTGVCLGYDQVFDAFGGTYFPGSYEADDLAGAVRILGGAQAIRTAAWEAVHRAHRVPAGRRLAALALRTALALDHLFRALAAIGVYRYEPGTQICGVTGYEPLDTVQVTGLAWLAGAAAESGPPTMRAIAAFLSGAGS
jgi:hypothetical protein